jgi:hypothetical protein
MDLSQEVSQAPIPVADEPALDELERFRRRGRYLFTFLAVVSAVFGSLVIFSPGGVDRPVLSWLVGAVGIASAFVVSYVLVMGLSDGRPWADRAAVVACSALLAAGVLRSLGRLTAGAFEIPIDAIGAALVLAAQPASFRLGSMPDLARGRVVLIALGAGFAALSPLIAEEVAAGRILGATPDQVTVNATVDCSGIAADPSAPILVGASWDWSGGELLAASADAIYIRWFGSTDVHGEDDLDVHVDGQVAMEPVAAVWPGSGGAASTLTDPIEARGNARAFGIDVAGYGLIDGSVVVPLRPVSAAARHGWVQVAAGYVHRDRWIKETENLLKCSW